MSEVSLNIPSKITSVLRFFFVVRITETVTVMQIRDGINLNEVVTFGYCGARTVKEFKEKAKLVRVTSAGLREAHPHDVTLLKDAPNYTASKN